MIHIISSKLRIDKGTETGKMATMHAFLRKHHGDMDPIDTVIYGPSTSNQVCFIALSTIYLSACALKNSVVKKHSYLKELLKLFRLHVTIYNFSIFYYVLEILRFI